MRPQPKPQRDERARKPLRRKTWMRYRRTTKHARRERQFGKMAFLATRPCDVVPAFWEVVLALPEYEGQAPGPCRGRVEVMHLREHAQQHRASEDRVAPGCGHQHHKDIDGKVGGRGPWWVALGRELQAKLKDALSARATAAWMALSPEERAGWDAKAAAQGRLR